MCLLVLAWRVHPRYRLVVAANRDEFHERPAAALARWPAPADDPRRPRPACRRHLARPGPAAALRRGDQLPRAAATAARRALARRAHPALPRPLRRARGSSWPRSQPQAGELLRLQPAARRPASRCGTAPTARHPSRAPLAPGVYGLSNEFLDTPVAETRARAPRLRGLAAADAGAAPDGLFALPGRPHARQRTTPAARHRHLARVGARAFRALRAASGLRHALLHRAAAARRTERCYLAERRFDRAGAPARAKAEFTLNCGRVALSQVARNLPARGLTSQVAQQRAAAGRKALEFREFLQAQV